MEQEWATHLPSKLLPSPKGSSLHTVPGDVAKGSFPSNKFPSSPEEVGRGWSLNDTVVQWLIPSLTSFPSVSAASWTAMLAIWSQRIVLFQRQEDGGKKQIKQWMRVCGAIIATWLHLIWPATVTTLVTSAQRTRQVWVDSTCSDTGLESRAQVWERALTVPQWGDG